jgi:hypothetical protein
MEGDFSFAIVVKMKVASTLGTRVNGVIVDTAIGDINKKTDLHIEIESLEKVGNKVNALNFSIKPQKPPKAGRPPT